VRHTCGQQGLGHPEPGRTASSNVISMTRSISCRTAPSSQRHGLRRLQRLGFCPSCGAWRTQTAADLVDHVILHVPVRQWVLALPIPLRLLLAARPKLLTLGLQVVHRVITRFMLSQAGLKADNIHSGADHADPTLRVSGQSQHSPALPGVGRRIPV